MKTVLIALLATLGSHCLADEKTSVEKVLGTGEHRLGEFKDPRHMISLYEWIEDGSGDAVEKAIDDSIKLMACHGSIRANQRLTEMEIKTMLEQLDACENPSNCPHGRPTWIKLEKAVFEKLFKRVV